MLRHPDTGAVLFCDASLACPATGEVVLAPGFGAALVALRVAFGRPMRVSSCCRSAKRNRAIGGHPRSLHVYRRPHHPTGGACAIDIAVADANYAWNLAWMAISRGWSVGVSARGFIHLDRRSVYTDLPPALFGYS